MAVVIEEGRYESTSGIVEPASPTSPCIPKHLISHSTLSCIVWKPPPLCLQIPELLLLEHCVFYSKCFPGKLEDLKFPFSYWEKRALIPEVWFSF